MFEIGWTELLVVAMVAIVVFPSKDLPKLLRTTGQMVGKARRMASDFQSQFSAALKEAEREADLEDVRKEILDIKNNNPVADVRKALDPIRNAGNEIRRDLMAQPAQKTPPPGAVAIPNEPPAAAGGAAPTEAAGPAPAPAAPAPVPTPNAVSSAASQMTRPPLPPEGGSA